jgi:hypothetical protein
LQQKNGFICTLVHAADHWKLRHHFHSAVTKYVASVCASQPSLQICAECFLRHPLVHYNATALRHCSCSHVAGSVLALETDVLLQNDDVSTGQFIRVEFDRKTTMNCEWIRKKVIVASVALLSKKKVMKFQSGYTVPGRRFELNVSQIQVC